MQSLAKPKHDYIWLTIAGLLPLVLCLIFTFIEARNSVISRQKSTAAMLIDQANHISDMAWKMVDNLHQFSGRECDDIRSPLQQFGALSPYYRSLGLVHGTEIYCSSAFGSQRGSVEAMIRTPLPVPRQPSWMLSVAGTFGVKDRPGVVLMHEVPDGFGAYAVIDGQYLIDFMDAVGQRRGHYTSITFGNGYRISSGKTLIIYGGILGTSSYTTTSSRYPISVTITMPRAEALQSWQRILITFMPMAVILSLLVVMLTSHWLKRRGSFRDVIRRGIERGEFSVNYQPVYDLPNGRLSGAEALLRWQRSDGRWVRPDVFIATAEDIGMIIPLTRHLLDMVAKECSQWQVPPGFHLAINVAAESLQHEDFVSDIRQFASKIAHLKAAITLELTERSLIRDGELVERKLSQLRREGIKVAIDDFGTGHCSLSYLQTFSIDYLKIDKGFVNAIESVDGETPVLDAIIMLAHKLEMSVVAEGVENAMQLEYLRRHGVVFIQGYHYARPMDNAGMMKWIEQQNSPTESSE